MPTALSTFLFWTWCPEFWCKAIANITDGPFGHMGVGFTLSDPSDPSHPSDIYYEALADQGWTGPHDLAVRRASFLSKDPRSVFVVVPLNLSEEVSEGKRQQAQSMCGVWSYGKLQLASMLLCERLWIPVPRSKTSVVCSEAVARILAPEFDLRDARRTSFDEVSPNSAWHRLLEIQSGHGAITAAPIPCPPILNRQSKISNE